MTVDQDSLRRKNDELVQAYKEKTRKLLQTQELYDKLKRKAMLGQMQDAAESAAESVLHGSPSSGPHESSYFQILAINCRAATSFDRWHHSQPASCNSNSTFERRVQPKTSVLGKPRFAA